MNDLIKKLNETVGALRAVQDYLSDERKLLVDNSITRFPMIQTKDQVLSTINRAEQTILSVVDVLCRNEQR